MSLENLDDDTLELVLLHCKKNKAGLIRVNKNTNKTWKRLSNPINYYALVQGYNSPRRGEIYGRGFFATIYHATCAARYLSNTKYGTKVPFNVPDDKFILIESGPKMHWKVRSPVGFLKEDDDEEQHVY